MAERTANPTLSLNEVADELGVHYMTAYNYVRTGRLPGTQENGQWRVQRDDLEAFRARPRARPGRRAGKPRTPRAEQLERCLVRGDEPAAWKVIETALAAGSTPTEVHLEVIVPAMHSVGDRWACGELSITDEHRASAVTLRLLGRLGPQFRLRGRPRGTVVVGTNPGDLHGLPTAIASDLLRAGGYRVIDLGPYTTAGVLRDAAESADRLEAVVVSVTSSDRLDDLELALTTLTAEPAFVVITGGPGVDEATALTLGATAHLDDLAELTAAIQAVRDAA